MIKLNPAHFALFIDWHGHINVQYRRRGKLIDAIKLNRRGLLLVTCKQGKLRQRGIRYLPSEQSGDVLGKVMAYCSLYPRHIDEGVKEILSQVYAVLGGTTTQGEGSKPGSPAKTPAGTKPASTTRAGAAE